MPLLPAFRQLILLSSALGVLWGCCFRLQPTPLTSPAVPTARVVPVAVMAPVIGVMALGWCAAIMARSGARGAMGLSAATVASAVARMRPEPCAAIGIRSGCWYA